MAPISISQVLRRAGAKSVLRGQLESAALTPTHTEQASKIQKGTAIIQLRAEKSTANRIKSTVETVTDSINSERCTRSNQITIMLREPA